MVFFYVLGWCWLDPSFFHLHTIYPWTQPAVFQSWDSVWTQLIIIVHSNRCGLVLGCNGTNCHTCRVVSDPIIQKKKKCSIRPSLSLKKEIVNPHQSMVGNGHRLDTQWACSIVGTSKYWLYSCCTIDDRLQSMQNIDVNHISNFMITWDYSPLL